jgi:hypothetical protein
VERVVVGRDAVLAFRSRRHQLDRAAGAAAHVTDVDLLDIGVPDTGPDGARWALAVRGAPMPDPTIDPTSSDDGGSAPALDPDLAYVWTVRSSPQAYRRRDLPQVAVATSPWSEADAAKRVFDAARPLHAAGIPVLDALAHVARLQRELVVGPTPKGELSGRLTEALDPAYLRECRPCGVIHPYELPFRLAALQAGLELEPGTAPPVLHRIEGLEPLAFSVRGTDAPARFDLVRGYLRFYGPARPKDVAEFLDTSVKEVKARWPDDVVEVEVVDDRGTVLPGPWSVLTEDLDELLVDPAVGEGQGTVRLVGPYDPYVQLRGRELLVDDAARRKELWPVLGRPGAVLEGGEVVGVWRPKASGRKLAVRYEPWGPDRATQRRAVGVEAERLAAHRGVTFAGLVAP